MLASRGFNIDSLAVGETEDPNLSRMTFVVHGDDAVLEQVRKQLDKLVTIVQVQDISDQLHMSLVKEVANPSPATGKVDRISVSFKYGPPFGVRTISVIAVGRDAHGARVTSNPFAARQSITIWPFAKSSLLF